MLKLSTATIVKSRSINNNDIRRYIHYYIKNKKRLYTILLDQKPYDNVVYGYSTSVVEVKLIKH